MDKYNLLNYLEEMKHSNLKFTYKDAFDVKEEEVKVDMNIQIKDPDAWYALRQFYNPGNPSITRYTEWNDEYKMKKLMFLRLQKRNIQMKIIQLIV